MKRALKIIAGTMLVLLLVLAAAVGFVAGTDAGLRWAIGLAERGTAGKLAVGEVQGSLWRGFELRNLRFDDTGLEMGIEVLRAQWQPGALLQGTVRIRSLYAAGIDVRTQPGAEQPSEPGTFPPQFSLPIGVSLRDARIENLAVHQGEQTPLRVEQIELGAGLRGDRLRLRRLTVKTADLEASAQGRLEFGDDYSTDLTLQWTADYQGRAWRGQAAIAGDRENLNVEHRLSGPVDAQLQAQVEDVFDALRWQARLDVDEFDADSVLAQLRDPSAEALPAIGRVRASVRAHGDDTRVVVERLRVVLPEGDRSVLASGELTELGSATPVADLNLQWQNLQWPLQQTAQVRSAEGKAQFEGWLEQFRLRLDADAAVTTPEAPAQLKLQADVRSDGEVLKINQLRAQQVDGPARLQARGEVVQWRSDAPQLDLHAQWESLQWPLRGEPQVASAQGRADVRGSLSDYRFGTELQLRSPQLAASQWRIEGQGDLQQARFGTIAAQLLEGSLDGNGSVDWSGPLQWQLALQLQNLDPGVIDPAWRGSLSGSLDSEGVLQEQGPSARLQIPQLQGTLRDRSFTAQVNLNLELQRLQVDEVQVRSGDAVLALQGSYGEQRIDLTWNLDARELSDLLPQASGSLHANGTLQGEPGAPQLKLSLRGEKPRWQEYGAAAVRGEVQGGVGAGQKLDIDVSVTGLEAGGFAARQVALTGSGSAEQHRIELKVEREDGDFETSLAGGLQPSSAWRGEIRTLSLRQEPLGTWRLRQPAPLMLSAEQADLEQLCLQQEQSALCLAGRWSGPEGWSADTKLTDLPLAMASPFLPPGVRLEGSLDGDGKVAANARGLAAVDVGLRLSAGSVRYRVDSERTIEESFSGGNLTVAKQEGQLRGDLNIQLSGQDRISGQARVALPGSGNGGWADSSLQGRLELRMARLDLVEVFVPQVSNLDGSVQAALDLGGSVGSPRVTGTARARADQFEVPQLGTVIEDLDVAVTDTGGGVLQLQGSARSGGGILRLDGRFEPQGGNPWRARVNLTGDRFLASNSAEAKVYVSPDLQVEAVPKRVDVTGSVTVPEAHLTPKEGRSVVKPSSDVVVVRGDEPAAPEEAQWQVYARVNLKLGDKVRFTGYGFDGRVSGGLELNDAPKKITTATGSLNIEDASYTAYGRTLEVDRGRLAYSGNPVTNPGLDFVATRTVDDKRVGVMVSGTAADPRVKLFSNPNMSEGDILAYLVLGRPLNSAGEADGDALRAAASSFGIAKGSALAESIGQQLGFEDVSVTSGGTGDSAQPWLTVGRYLSPELYVSYGVGLFEPGSVVRVRYELTEHWKVQGESGGTSSGADLLYTIER